jgi:hypothetical protein
MLIKMIGLILVLSMLGCYPATRCTIYTNNNADVQMLRNAKDIKIISIREMNDTNGRWHIKYKTK